MPTEWLTFFTETVPTPRYVLWIALLTSPALWSRWAKQQFENRFMSKQE